MNNYLYEMPNNWYQQFNTTFNPMNTKNNDLTTPKEGFLRGNLFDNLYDPYRNYKYMELTPRSKREEVLLNLLKYKFAITELNLYLDVYPNNQEYLNLLNKYLMEEKKLCDMYEKSYGPLTLDGINNANYFDWVKSPWPWEVVR